MPQKTQLSIIALTVANLCPLFGVLFFGWDAAVIVLLYWTENLVIGAYHVLRMIFLKVNPPIAQLGKLVAIPFFCVHFGGFCALHGFFLLAFFKIGPQAFSVFPKDTWPGPLVFVQLLVSVIGRLWESRPAGMEWAVMGLIASHGTSFVQHYLLAGEYRSLTMNNLMSRPYKRIVLLHVAIIAGAMPIMMLGSPVPLLCILVILKVGLDIWLHNKSHRPQTRKKRRSRKLTPRAPAAG